MVQHLIHKSRDSMTFMARYDKIRKCGHSINSENRNCLNCQECSRRRNEYVKQLQKKGFKEDYQKKYNQLPIYAKRVFYGFFKANR